MDLSLFMNIGVEKVIKRFLMQLRRRLIVLLAGKRITVMLNCTLFDEEITYNIREADILLIDGCKTKNLSEYVDGEIKSYEMNRNKGVYRRRNTYVLACPNRKREPWEDMPLPISHLKLRGDFD